MPYVNLLRKYNLGMNKRNVELEIENSEQFKEKWVQDNLEMTFEKTVNEPKLKAFQVAKKVFRCNSLYKHHIYSAYESGWITEEEYNLLIKEIERD